MQFLPVIIVLFFLLTSAVKIVKEYERLVVFRLGRLMDKPKGPGVTFVIPILDKIERISLRIYTMDVPSQDVITRDNVTMKVNAVVYFKVVDPNRAVTEVQDFLFATSQLAQTTLALSNAASSSASATPSLATSLTPTELPAEDAPASCASPSELSSSPANAPMARSNSKRAAAASPRSSNVKPSASRPGLSSGCTASPAKATRRASSSRPMRRYASTSVGKPGAPGSAPTRASSASISNDSDTVGSLRLHSRTQARAG